MATYLLLDLFLLVQRLDFSLLGVLLRLRNLVIETELRKTGRQYELRSGGEERTVHPRESPSGT